MNAEAAAPNLPSWLQVLYPFTPRIFLTPDKARMSYLDEGPRTSEAVLMLHGNPTWSFYFRNLVRALSPNLRCIVPDHIGMGLSEKPQDYDYTLATRIKDIMALVDSLGLTRVHLVVHDWGGAIGFGFATRQPHRLGRMVILNTAAFPSTNLSMRIALCRNLLVGELLVRGLNGFAWPATWMAMSARSLTAEEKRGFLFPYDTWKNRVAIHRFVQDIPMEQNHPSRSILEHIASGLPGLASHEKLILWGGKDFCFNDTFLARWREIYPEAQVVRYPSAGHYVIEDSEESRERIITFLLNSPPS